MPELSEIQSALAGRYEVERQLGQGGMATVFLAYDPRHDRRVALKVLRAELAATLGPERFLREIRIAANLSHPHVVPLYDSGEVNGLLFYVMPYIEGETLADRIRRAGPLPVDQAVQVLREVADALMFAHQRGLVHRDIKPDNVMIADRHALVMDFGVAKAVSGSGPAEGLTHVGTTVGTPAYMAPEQVAADPDVDHRADIYAVGILAYEMLSGKPPFADLSPTKTFAAHIAQDPVPLSTRAAGVPPELAAVIMRCLAKDPAERWQTAEELWNALGTAGAGGAAAVATEPARPGASGPGQQPAARAHPLFVNRFIRELQRREVFGTLGLYVGICWILIEASSVVLPAFGAPDWALRGLIIAAVIGFPIAAVLAWIYDITAHGIVVQGKASDTVAPSPGGGKTNLVVIGVLSVALVFSLYLNFRGGAAPAAVRGSVSIAVLPFVNMSADAEQEYFSDGISEELLNLLAKIPQFRVAGRTSSFAFKGTNDDLRTIGDRLGVGTILEGSVRKSGERVRITAQLVNVSDGFHLWSETYDRELTDIFAVQDEIASAVAGGLKVTLLGDSPGDAEPQHGVNAEAYNAYLQGLFYLNKAGPTNKKTAASHLEAAVALEPDFAPAWAGLGNASTIYAAMGSEDTEQALRRGREAAAKALELDPDLPEAHYALGYGEYFFDWDWDAAESSYRRALELRPGYVSAGGSLARLIGDRGRIDEALDMFRSLVAADPLDESLQLQYVAKLFDRGDLEAVDSVVTALLEANPSLNSGRMFLAWARIYQGRLDEAVTLAEAEPTPLGRWVALAMAHHRLGNRAAAVAAQQALLKAYGNLAAYQQAWIYTSWGETDEAVRWLEIAYDARDPGLTGLKIDFILRPLREHPGYRALLEKMQL